MKRSRGDQAGGRTQRRLASADGSIGFVLQRSKAGVHIERTHVVGGTLRLAYCLLLANEEEFAVLSEEDRLRFEHPHLFLELGKAFRELYGQGC